MKKKEKVLKSFEELEKTRDMLSYLEKYRDGPPFDKSEMFKDLKAHGVSISLITDKGIQRIEPEELLPDWVKKSI